MNAKTKKTIEKNISALLTELSDASAAGRKPDVKNIDMYQDVAETLGNLWNRLQFAPIKPTTISRGREGLEEMHVMIPVLITKNTTGFELPQEGHLSISLEENGTISGLRMGMLERNDIVSVFDGADNDLAKRIEIVTWLDDYYTWFLRKDISELADFLCGTDGLKFTLNKTAGTAGVNRKREQGPMNEQLNKIISILHGSEKHAMKIDAVSLHRSAAKPDIYGLTFRQTVTELSTGKSSSDWMFLLWDFDHKEGESMFPVRIVQPGAAPGEACEVSLDDFDFE